MSGYATPSGGASSRASEANNLAYSMLSVVHKVGLVSIEKDGKPHSGDGEEGRQELNENFQKQLNEHDVIQAVDQETQPATEGSGCSSDGGGVNHCSSAVGDKEGVSREAVEENGTLNEETFAEGVHMYFTKKIEVCLSKDWQSQESSAAKVEEVASSRRALSAGEKVVKKQLMKESVCQR